MCDPSDTLPLLKNEAICIFFDLPLFSTAVIFFVHGLLLLLISSAFSESGNINCKSENRYDAFPNYHSALLERISS
jgi:hypothetical protein